ncbi:hypothetical protein ACLOJK_031763 [Asimina triloba]
MNREGDGDRDEIKGSWEIGTRGRGTGAGPTGGYGGSWWGLGREKVHVGALDAPMGMERDVLLGAGAGAAVGAGASASALLRSNSQADSRQ